MSDVTGQDPARPGWAAPGVSVYAWELAGEICRRVAAGESLRRICGRAGMPHRTTLMAWREAHAEFAEALARAQREARLAARRQDRARMLVLERRPKPARGGRASSYTRQTAEAICLRLMEGESLTQIARDPDMPCYGTILKWVKRHPEFDEAYTAAREVQADYFFDEARDVALATTPKTVWADRLKFDVIRWQAARLAPRKYVERILVIDQQDVMRRTAAEEAVQDSRVQRFCITRFERGPDGSILAIPPRNEAEEARYEAAHGQRYDGPHYQTVERDR
jgi:transposase-like protein